VLQKDSSAPEESGGGGGGHILQNVHIGGVEVFSLGLNATTYPNIKRKGEVGKSFIRELLTRGRTRE